MTFTEMLCELPAERLRAIVQRRAVSMRSIPRIGGKRQLAHFLAETLSTPQNVSDALAETDLLQVRLLVYAIVHRGEVSLEAAVAEAGETARESIGAAARELERNGLAVLRERSSNSNGAAQPELILWVPPGVRQNTPLPLPLRTYLPDAITHYDSAALTTIARTIGAGDLFGAITKQQRAEEIAEALAQPHRVAALVAGLSDGGRNMLQYVMSRGGASDLTTLAAQVEARQRNQLYSYDWSRRWSQGKPRNAVEELLQHGLLVLDRVIGWGYGHIVVPGNVMSALLGRPQFLSNLPSLPAWDTISAAAAPVRRHTTLLRDVAFLLGYVGRAEAGRTAKGVIHRNALKQIAKGLSIPVPEYAAFVYALSREAGLIDAPGRTDVYEVTGQGLAWLELPIEEQLRALYEIWRSQTTFSEITQDSLTDGSFYYTEQLRQYRACTIALLTGLAHEHPDALGSMSSMVARAEFRWWTRFPSSTASLDAIWGRRGPAEQPTPNGRSAHGAADPDDGDRADSDLDEQEWPGATADRTQRNRVLLSRIVASLYYLGLVEATIDAHRGPESVALSPRGRHRLLGEPAAAAEGEAQLAFVVQPNLEIYTPPDLAPRLLYRLFRVADPTASAAGGMLTLNRETLRRALDRGETADGLLEFLRQHSSTGVPQNVEYLIREVGGRHGHIRIGQAGLYMQVSDPMLLKELMAQKKLNVQFRAQLADTVALITGDSVEAILRQLRQAGYFPVAAGETEKKRGAGGSSAAATRRRYNQPSAPRSRTPDVETQIDWSAVERDDCRDIGAKSLPEGSSGVGAKPVPALRSVSAFVGQAITTRIRRAIADMECLELEYRESGTEDLLTHHIEPVQLAGKILRAYDRGAEGYRVFDMRFIEAARPTGELFERR